MYLEKLCQVFSEDFVIQSKCTRIQNELLNYSEFFFSFRVIEFFIALIISLIITSIVIILIKN